MTLFKMFSERIHLPLWWVGRVSGSWSEGHRFDSGECGERGFWKWPSFFQMRVCFTFRGKRVLRWFLIWPKLFHDWFQRNSVFVSNVWSFFHETAVVRLPVPYPPKGTKSAAAGEIQSSYRLYGGIPTDVYELSIRKNVFFSFTWKH